MKLEERICACGCGKTFRCLPSSQTRYSSRHCMEMAGALPPEQKFGRGSRPLAPAGASSKDDSRDDAPLALEEDELSDDLPHKGPSAKNPPKIDPAA